MQQVVGAGQVFKFEAGARGARVVQLSLIGFARPFDAVGPQRVGHANHVQQVPAATVVLPFAGVRIDQVAPEKVAGHFVVKTNRVVTHANRAGLGQQLFDLRSKFMLWQTPLQADLWRDTGQHAGLGVGQVVVGGAAVNHHRLADFV